VSAIGDLLSVWGISVAAEARRTNRGSNNTTFTIRHDDECWVLRVSQNLSAPQVAAEHRLLERLRRAGLPFAVPEPFAALDGRTVVETGEGPATVCRWLAGVPADTRPLQTAARRVMEWWDTSGENLPVQVVHGDPAASNTLADPRSGRVTAILDFEFAGTDFRAQDIVVALYSSGALDGPGWKLRAAPLIAGFSSSARLTEPEIRALPAMILWRSVGTVPWRAGRWRRGLDDSLFTGCG
jgi:Ser/Thr protein kinase RdoA (MazF antagonist)